jgi:hypothetical protein
LFTFCKKALQRYLVTRFFLTKIENSLESHAYSSSKRQLTVDWLNIHR